MRIITKTDDLAAFSTAVRQHPFVAVDTEFMREKTYWPILCLIQAAAGGEEAIIDPLAPGIDLAPFLELLADNAVIKVFHAARQDVEIFHHLTGCVPAPMFDSQIAAMACGFGDQIGYEPLMRSLLNAQIDKGSRFTDWARRPLTDAQLTYALSDVTHLRDAYPIIMKMLEPDNRSQWVAEEMDALLDPNLYFTRPEDAWRRMKLRNIRPAELGPLIKLAEWRERDAQAKDVPRSRILKDDALFELARLRPETPKDMARARSIGGGFERSKAADGILRAVADGIKIDRDTLPKLEAKSRKETPPADVVDLLRVLLKRQCETYDVAPKLIASLHDIEAIALYDHADVPAMTGWRYDIFGGLAQQLKRGEIALKLDGKKVDVFKSHTSNDLKSADS